MTRDATTTPPGSWRRLAAASGCRRRSRLRWKPTASWPDRGASGLARAQPGGQAPLYLTWPERPLVDEGGVGLQQRRARGQARLRVRRGGDAAGRDEREAL